MSFQNTDFVYYLFILLIPIIIFILQRFLLPSENIASLLYILEQRGKTESLFHKEFVKLILQLLILFFLIAAAGDLSCVSKRNKSRYLPVAVIDDSFPLSKTKQGERSSLYEIKKQLGKLAVKDIYLLSDLLNGKIKPVSIPGSYYNADLELINSFSEIEKKLLIKYKSLLEIHYFSAFCFTHFYNTKIKSIHKWVYHPFTNRQNSNLYFSGIEVHPDPMSTGRMIIKGRVEGELENDKKIYVSINVNSLKQGLLKISDAKRNFRFPVESKEKTIKAYLELSGDDLLYDNRYYMVFENPGKIKLHILGDAIWPLMKNIFEPDSLNDSTRFKVIKEKDKFTITSNADKQTVYIFYGSYQEYIKKKAVLKKKKVIWFYQAKTESALIKEKFIFTALSLDEGKIIRNTNLSFHKILSSFANKAEVLAEFEDSSAAVLKNQDASIYILFDVLSADNDTLYSIDFLYFIQNMVNEFYIHSKDMRINSAFLAKEKFSFLPSKPGFILVNENTIETEEKKYAAYNPSPELSACFYPPLSKLTRVFPGDFTLSKNKNSTGDLTANIRTLYFILSGIFLLFYLYIFKLTD